MSSLVASRSGWLSSPTVVASSVTRPTISASRFSAGNSTMVSWMHWRVPSSLDGKALAMLSDAREAKLSGSMQASSTAPSRSSSPWSRLAPAWSWRVATGSSRNPWARQSRSSWGSPNAVWTASADSSGSIPEAESSLHATAATPRARAQTTATAARARGMGRS